MNHNIYRYGQKVLIGSVACRIEAVVVGCMFLGPDFGQVRYLVRRWSESSYKVEWLDAIEVEASDEDKPRAVMLPNGVNSKD